MKLFREKNIIIMKKNFRRIFSLNIYRKPVCIDRKYINIYSIKLKIPETLYKIITNYYVNNKINKIKFAINNKPKYSIIIPIYNNLYLTMKCLDSLSKINLINEFEVILINDSSSDRSAQVLKKIQNINYIENKENLGFIKSCNKASEGARGDYLVFLNNDTILKKDWLYELARTFEDCDGVGLVGSKLIYPDNRLQEAGGIVWSDGNASNWLRKRDPRHPLANYMREVDYVTGASIMISRQLFEDLGRFDERYQHSYYEDTDLAMAVRKAGYRVIYQPKSELIHYEGASSGRDVNLGAKRYQVINREIFSEKWRDELKLHHERGVNPARAADRQAIGDILIVDSAFPNPDRDSGSVDMFNLINIMLDLKYRVHFIALDSFYNDNKYVKNLQRMGVNCIYQPYYSTLESFINDIGDIFEYVFICRKKYANNLLNSINKLCKKSSIIFYTVDLHFLRELREARLSVSRKKREKAQKSFLIENKIIDTVDCTIVLSNKERKLLNILGKNTIRVLPLIRNFSTLNPPVFSMRSGVSFIGGYKHLPNVDAVDFLVNEIWPELRTLLKKRGLPPIVLKIFGADMPARFYEYQCDDIIVGGYVADLDDAFSDVRLSIAPLRYGAGLKGKLATSFGYGVPAIGSWVAYEGFDIQSKKLLCVPSFNPLDYAEALLNIYNDFDRLSKLSLEVYEYAVENYSYDNVKQQVSSLFIELKDKRKSAGLESR